MSLAVNLDKIQTRIADACRRVNRDPRSVQILAVSKYATEQAVQELYGLGVTAFGESRIQQARQRMQRLPHIQWHFVGTLQTNKVKYCSDFQLIHSLDRLSLAEAVNMQGEKWGRPVDMLVQVNVSGEPTKHGVAVEEAMDFVHEVNQKFPWVSIRGLMTMAPLAKPEEVRPVFRQLAQLGRQIAQNLDVDMSILSMGMSNDYEVAVEEGATIVRIGSALFDGEG